MPNKQKKLKVLIIGSGGREHALYEKIKMSPLVERVIVAPGNGGIPTRSRYNVKADDLDGLLKLAKEKRVDLTVVGPEKPLVNGIVDLFEANGLRIFGPSKAAAKLEGSKAYCKEICTKYDVPTAEYQVCKTERELLGTIANLRWDLAPVVKADGLCAGKGVLVPKTYQEAAKFAVDLMLRSTHGEAGKTVVLERRLEGRECSVMALTDGEVILLLQPARDYKRAHEGDEGDNTGGMGAYSPLPDLDRKTLQEIGSMILRLVLGMAEEGHVYKGVLYAGIMLTKTGPMLLEVNCRFGDPETQVVLPRMESDLVPYLLACAGGRIHDVVSPQWSKKAAVCVVMTKTEYPNGKHYLQTWVNGVEDAQDVGALVYHAGTEYNGVNRLVAAGGRVLNIVGMGSTIADARAQAYAGCKPIWLNELRYRKDIAAGV